MSTALLPQVHGPGRPRAFLAFLAFLLLALLLSPPVGGAQHEATEAELKAAFLFNFATYVQWPAGRLSGQDAPLTFGVLGGGAVAEHLEAIVSERPVNGHPGTVRRLRRREDLNGLHVLFLGQEYQHLVDDLLPDALHDGVLTVTENNELRPPASVINLAVIDERVRFDVSLDAAQQGGLEISARLLQLAREVIGQAP